MSKKIAGLLFASLLVLAVMALLGPGVKPVHAQGKSHTIVIHESKHDQHALGPDDPLPVAGGQAATHHEIVLRLTHAPGIIKQMQDSALQTSTGPTVAATSGVNFSGVSANGYAPPDTNGAAGPTQYMQWVNVEFAVYNKSDGKLVYGPSPGNSIWSGFGGSCQNSNSGDPIVEYDKQAGRWVVMQPVFSSPYSICVAVSTTSDWTSSGITWNRYQFTVPSNTTNFPDYPKLAVWPDGYYLSYNSFTNGNSWSGPQACVMDRAKMLTGQSATMQCATTPPSNTEIDSWLPSDLDGAVPGVSGTTQAPPAGSPDYYVGIYAPDTTKLALFAYHVDWTTPANSTFTGPTLIGVNGFNEACGGGTCIQQPNTNQKLDSLADRLMYRLAYRNFGGYESLVVSQSVDPGNGTSGIRWYEIRSPGSSPFAYQQGTYAPDSNYRWMPSIAMDKVGDIAVGYSESSSSVAPSIYYTGRQVNDPLGTLETEAPILQGAFSQTSGLSRWGDYSAMSVDPSDDCTFWYTNEYLPYNGSFNWATQIASFVFPGCASPSGPSFAVSPSPSSQTVTAGDPTSYTLNVSPSNGYTGSVNLAVTSSLPSGVNVTFETNPVVISGTGSVSSTMSVTTSSSTPANTYTITVKGTDSSDSSLSYSTNVTLVVNSSGPPPDYTLSADSTTLTVPINSSTTDNITVTPTGNFTSDVTLSLSSLPRWVNSNFSVNPVTNGQGSSVLTISANRHAKQGGPYTLTLTATSGSLTHMLTLTLYVGTPPTPDFSLSASPSSQTVNPGSNATYTVSAAPSGGYTGNVALSVTNSSLPTGMTVGFNPNPVSITGTSAVTSTLTVNTTLNTPTGTYSLTISGTDGTTTHTTSVTVVVGSSSGGDFSLSASPSSQSVSAGSGTSYTVTVGALSGFTGTVALSASSLPPHSTASFSPASVGGSGTSTMTVNTAHNTHKKTYSITITGTSGSLSHSATVQLAVQ